jgi:hypothetical protein
MSYDSTMDTVEHIRIVQSRMAEVLIQLHTRQLFHDKSKLYSPEKEAFDRVVPKLQELEYGSEEHKAAVSELGEALKHHYGVNPHHPEHHIGGISDMSLIDVIEMFCDWKAASERNAYNGFGRSLEINTERFGVSDQLASIFENTRQELGW